MPDLIIDGRPVSVPKGTMVIEAAEALGIMIPRFCWHKALGAAGACRLCAVMFLEGPVKGLEMSCMTPAADGMVVSTFHPEAVAFRRRVIELLMVNHPHDCPVCDEGGQCLLQDETISGNHALRRWPGRKRTYVDQDLGPFIQHEMNRCIHCYRCARFYQDYCGYRDFGPMQNANRVYFGRFESGPLENPFAGNLADLCPTGTLTDKPSRFTARRWDCQRAPSVCLHCSLGCNTVALSRYREVVRIEARNNDAVNGAFLCDRGRFAHGYASAPGRPREARLDGRTVSVAEALAVAAGRLGAVMADHGPQAVAVVGPRRAPLETQAALVALAKTAGWRAPAFFRTGTERRAVRRALAVPGPGRIRSLAAVSRADTVVCLGVSPLFDAPMLALALRQVTRNGGTVIVADPRPVNLPLPYIHLPVAPQALPDLPGLLTAPPGDAAALAQQRLPLIPELWPRVEQAATALAAASRPTLVFAPELAEHLPDDDRFGLLPVLYGANAAGAALVSPDDATGCDALAKAVTSGQVKALVVVEAGLFDLAPELAGILDNLKALVVLDHLPTATATAASIFLPTATLFESGGTLVNSEGRLQRATPVQITAAPVRRDGNGSHPPRAYDHGLPGAAPRPAADLLTTLAGAMALPLPTDPLADVLPALADIDLRRLPAEGLRPDTLFDATPKDTPPATSTPAAQGLAVVFDQGLFDTEILSRFAPLPQSLQPAGPDIRIHIHPDSAAAQGLGQGDTVIVEAGARPVTARIRLAPTMAQGVIVVPDRPEFAGLPPVLGPGALRRK